MCKKTFKIQAVFNGSQNGVRHYIIKNAKFITFAKLRGTYKKKEKFSTFTLKVIPNTVAGGTGKALRAVLLNSKQN